MEYRILGKTGLRVSALGFGGSSLGSVFRPVSESEAVATVRGGRQALLNVHCAIGM